MVIELILSTCLGPFVAGGMASSPEATQPNKPEHRGSPSTTPEPTKSTAAEVSAAEGVGEEADEDTKPPTSSTAEASSDPAAPASVAKPSWDAAEAAAAEGEAEADAAAATAAAGQADGTAATVDADATAATEATPRTLSATEPIESPAPAPPRRARPIRWRVDSSIEVGGTAVLDRGYLAFQDGPGVGLSQLGLGLRADNLLGRRLFLGGGVRYGLSLSRGSIHVDQPTRIVLHEPVGFVRLALRAVEGLDVVGQVGAGPSISAVAVFDDDDEPRLQRRVTGMFSALGGASLYLPKAWLHERQAARVTAGLDFMFGYTLRGPVVVTPSRSDAGDRIRTHQASLGDMTMSGFTWTIGLFVRAM